MISYNQSREILKNSRILIGDQIIKSSDCINRVASENIFSKVNNPAGNNAAFDGYAVSSKDTSKLNKKKSKLFKIIGIVAAGDKPTKKRKQKFQTIEIMTGGLLPKGFDTVIPIEQIIFYPNKKNPSHIIVDRKIKKQHDPKVQASSCKPTEM